MIQQILDLMNQTAFTAFGAGTTWTEIFGFVTGLLCVYLVARANVWNFPIGILNAAFFMILFLHVNLYADGYLQIMYLVLNAAGWYIWLKRGPNSDKRPVMSSWKYAVLLVPFVAIFTYFFAPYLASHDDPYPTLDALTTGLSVAAQILLSLKYIQNWVFWIVADLFYIPLYFAKDLNLTAIVYVAFLGLSIFGWFAWHRMRNPKAPKTHIFVPSVEGPGNTVAASAYNA